MSTKNCRVNFFRIKVSATMEYFTYVDDHKYLSRDRSQFSNQNIEHNYHVHTRPFFFLFLLFSFNIFLFPFEMRKVTLSKVEKFSTKDQINFIQFFSSP